VAERNGLLNRRTGYTVPWVRIPLSPQKNSDLEGNQSDPTLRMKFLQLFKKNIDLELMKLF